jgi:CheY-like chemotaxis protein
MSVQGRPTVLLVEEHEETRALYVETLTAEGCHVLAAESYEEIVPVAMNTRIDVAVIDIRLDAVALSVAERLAALPCRPRLIALTSRAATGASLEKLFDLYVQEPCLPEDLVEAMLSIATVKVPEQDLLIIAHERIVSEVVQRFGDIGAHLEIRVDRRHHERRRSAPSATSEERRRRDRRARDVSDRLSTAGWIFIPGAERS